MEKYSQFRDRASGIAPFFPVPAESSGVYLPVHLCLFFIRLPFLIGYLFTYFAILQWLPIGSLVWKIALWLILGTPGLWWVDLQVDGVKRGAVANNSSRLPRPGTIIASSFTSPIDPLYLATIFDPVFAASYPSTRLVRPISLFGAILRAFSQPELAPPADAKLMDLPSLIAANPHRVVAVFPECTTTNGRGILPLSPSLLTADPRTQIFPISVRYAAADITTPIPGSYQTFIWNILSRPRHSIRVRIAESVHITTSASGSARATGLESSYVDVGHEDGANNSHISPEGGDGMTLAEQRVLDRIGEALARMGRVKRVGLGVKDKSEFVKQWTRQRRS